MKQRYGGLDARPQIDPACRVAADYFIKESGDPSQGPAVAKRDQVSL